MLQCLKVKKSKPAKIEPSWPYSSLWINELEFGAYFNSWIWNTITSYKSLHVSTIQKSKFVATKLTKRHEYQVLVEYLVEHLIFMTVFFALNIVWTANIDHILNFWWSEIINSWQKDAKKIVWSLWCSDKKWVVFFGHGW